ncbi:MAG: 3-dehydroquinate synthase [Dehalococcoidia bacterium]|nr:3-dehydroquinate synthase [Dehalococcoidia bacterium]
MTVPRQIVLVGLSGVGKSSVGRELSKRLGWTLVDTDDIVRERTGQTPAQLIVAKGEAAFRDIEAQAVIEAVRHESAVIATGGGAFQRPANRHAAAERGLICFLDATPAEIARRLRSAPDGSDRPLLGDDIEARLYELERERRGQYDHADLWVPCLGMTPAEVATRIVQRWAVDGEQMMGLPSRLERVSAPGPALAPTAIVDTGTERYPIWVGSGERRRLPERMKMLGLLGRVFLISDANVIEQHGASIAEALDSAGISGASYVIPPGEKSKSLRVAQEIYGWLAAERAERRDVIIALGGGVVGDLAGYVAATYLRGMPVIQIPTSVLAMNDAAIGGKVAVDLPAGKNLVGAFHQPAAVISDVEVLSTLPRRSYLEGFAEVIKHAFILDADLLGLLERNGRMLASMGADPALLTAIIARSSRLKALVVSADPQERGLRSILNYGHTIGHGIETAAGLGRYLHGEAVSIGMAGAARIGTRMGVTSEDVAGRLNELLHAFDLPLGAPAVDHGAVLAAMRLDKKVSGGQMRFVLLEDIGRAVLRDDVAPALVEDVVRGLVAN